MLKYIARRILVGIPTLFAILLLSFMISRGVPGDPVNRELDGQYRQGSLSSLEAREREYKRLAHEKGLDRPVFYFSLTAMAYPDTMHRIVHIGERETLEEMVAMNGNWKAVQTYHMAWRRAYLRAMTLPTSTDEAEQVLLAQRSLEEMRTIADKGELDYHIGTLDSLVGGSRLLRDSLQGEVQYLDRSYAELLAHPSTWKCYVPALHFYGIDNQFHNWLMGLLRLDFGRSYVSRRPVATLIAEAAPWTVFMGFMSYLIAYMVAIPMGVFAVRKRNTWQDRATTIALFLLNSVPSFVMAMLLMTFLCNPAYLQLFPTSGVLSDGAERWPLFYRLTDHAHHLLLPTLVFSYNAIAFVSRQMRGGMIEVVHLDFIRTARAKGLPEGKVIWRHALRNSLLPIITHLSNLLPAMVGGALITEFIFSIPGMGQLTLNALGSYDHPVIIAVFTLSAVATLVGILLTDILYALVDPRISFSAK